MMARYYVLLGPPGAGKGTQAKAIADTLRLAHISSGDLFRENLTKQTELGRKAQVFINRGDLVPDDLTIDMVRDRLGKSDCVEGAILDGFPRTPAQAEALAVMLKGMNSEVKSVPLISVPPEVLLERLSGRFSCRAAGHVYHSKYHPPKIAGICDVDGSELYQREDDKAETVQNRISVYLEQTAPLIEYYRSRGLLHEVDGTLEIDEVTKQVLAAL
jgi:adenylate kinase